MLLTGYGGLLARPPGTSARAYRRGPRHQPADPRDLVPALPPRARPEAPDRAGPPGAARGLRARRPERCSPAGWAIGSPPSSCTPTSGGVFDNPHRGLRRRDPAARDRRTRRCSPTGSTTSPRPSSAWPRRTSRTAPSRTPARRCGRCSTSWPTASTRGRDAHHPAIRALFTREALLASDWYHERLTAKQQRDIALWERHVRSLSEFLARTGHRDEANRLGIPARLEHARIRARPGTVAGVPHRAGRDDRGGPGPPADARPSEQPPAVGPGAGWGGPGAATPLCTRPGL